jgi:indole-3-glycerol phosphate synthase
LIAACLTPQEVKELAAIAKGIGLEVLLELHGEDELDHICPEVDLVGINNRNLKTFDVDLEHSVRLSQKIGNDFIKIAESGISDVKNIAYLKSFGFQGFLIGENFMKEKDPVQAFVRFAQKLNGGKHEV